MSKPRKYIEVVLRLYPTTTYPLQLDYVRGRTHDFANTLHFHKHRVVSVKRVDPAKKRIEPLLLNAEERSLAMTPRPTDWRSPSPYVQAIKKYRIRTGAMLKDAKERVDKFIASGAGR